MAGPIFKYRMLVQARTDLTPDEIARYEASRGNGISPKTWPWRDTDEIVHARRQTSAKNFYRAIKQIAPIIKIRAVRLPIKRSADRLQDHELMRAWRGFSCLCGSIDGAEDEVKHFEIANGLSACGLDFSTNHWKVNGKPECDKCLAAAVDKHPEMGQYL